MEKMLFSGVQSNADVALIAIKGIKNQPGIAAKVFGAIAEKKLNVELILQSIGRGDEKDISFVVAQEDAEKAVDTLKEAFAEQDYHEIVCDKEVGIVSIVGAGMMSNSGAASKMFEA
ncbi:ACT domain-containing protein, partial [Anaerostipes sp.]